jgi:hypothetical protein
MKERHNIYADCRETPDTDEEVREKSKNTYVKISCNTLGGSVVLKRIGVSR